MSDGVSQARYVVYVADSDPAGADETDVDFAVRICTEITGLVRTLAERDADKPAALWILTRRFTNRSPRPRCARVSCGALPVSSPPNIPSCGADWSISRSTTT